MSTPQFRQQKKKKLVVHLSGLNDIRIGTPAYAPPSIPRAVRPEPHKSSIADCTFEQYKAANLSIDDQHNVIGELRGELPIIDRDEVDDVLLRSMGQQLELGIFPTCKMMQIDPAAVKRMMDEQFRRAYGLEVEAEVLHTLGMIWLEDIVQVPDVQEREEADEANWRELTVEKARENGNSNPAPAAAATEDVIGVANALMELKESVKAMATVTPLGKDAESTHNEATQFDDRASETARERTPIARPNKKMKATPHNNTQKEIKAHIAKRKRGRHGVRMATLRSTAASEKWEALNNGP